jgi:hypothetical protein
MLNANCHSPHTLHTVGHSTRTLETLIGLLRLYSIEIVIDVRRWPASRRLPHFNRDALGAALKADRIRLSLAGRPRRLPQGVLRIFRKGRHPWQDLESQRQPMKALGISTPFM